jgi:putative transposase
MPNGPRLFVPGVSLHLRHRGNNRCAIFGDDNDYELFLVLLEAATKRHRVDVHGYALMTNHTHLQVTPKTTDGVSEAMKQLGAAYVLHFNKKYQRVGTLFTGRYKSKAIADDRYWLTCLRYIEHNPVRAGLVVQPEQYRWSSYRVHAFGESCEWLASHPILDAFDANRAERQARYRAICATPLTNGQIARQQFKN